MANKLINTDKLTAIADAIREKTGSTDTYSVDGMVDAISNISGGGDTPTKETVEWHQCPEAVRNYLANVTYDPSDYSNSQIVNYAPATPVASNTKPIGKTVGDVTYYNQVPNVETPFSADSSAGTLKPLDALRWINPGADSQGNSFCTNMRDLGGWPCDGGKVRYGLLYRCGQPSIYARPVLVEQLRIQRELDLQGQELSRTTSVMGNDIEYCRPSRYQWYTIADKAIWKEILTFLFEGARYGRPTIFHCYAGADRTGTVACIVEALLGVSQSDIDKDYELTTFDAGAETDLHARRRNESEWFGLISQINALPGSTFRDKVVNWVATMGFTAAEINAFRVAMIDGTPETVTPDIATYTVTNALTHATNDNTTTNITEYQPYNANITAVNGHVIGNVRVKMGGVDVTDSVWTGMETVLRHKVTVNLTHVTSDNRKKAVIDGQGYAATLMADVGYTLDGATISINMGGVDVSTYYKDGIIAIPNVTGDIEITVTAVESAPPYTNQIPLSTDEVGSIYNDTGYMTDHRINSSGAVATAESGGIGLDNCFVTGFIPVKGGDVIRLKGAYIEGESGAANTYCYKENRTVTGVALTPYQLVHNYNDTVNEFGPLNYNSELNRLYSFTVPDNSEIAYMRLTLFGNAADAIVTVNEPIE